MWPRDRFVKAVWASTLRPLERLVALVYADHARDQDFAYVTLPRLRERTGLSRDAVARARTSLVAARWLVVKQAAAQHHATRYLLVAHAADCEVPQCDGCFRGTSPSTLRGTGDGTLWEPRVPGDDTRVPGDDTRVPGDRPDYSADYSEDFSASRGAAPAAHREAASQLLARFGPGLDERTALAAVAAVARPGIRSLCDYLARFSLDDVLRYAEGELDVTRVALAKCAHGVHNGSQIRGTSSNASRICRDCEIENPAPAEARGA